MKTCWKSLPPFRAVGDALMKRYNKARNVHTLTEKNGLSLILKRYAFFFPWGIKCYLNLIIFRKGRSAIPKKHQKPKRMEMVYLQSSPNYCERDISLGSLGTVGRFCNRTARGKMPTSMFRKNRKY